ncbi:hypothetical protein Cni_G13027 [Canna indica]|uniref:Uncharacterized protein n=1 Tax=Canna indica TaxID=4628 RepID=A0AAQ3QCB5_9LILI|nr:hypothetical protein Cni_G13027 [Canna indica]
MTKAISLIAKPFSLVKISLLLGLRTAAFSTVAWWQLLKLAINFNVELCWQILVLGITFMMLPIRMLTALHNEVKLRKLLNEMQAQFEKLAWENKELEERLQIASEVQKIQETVFKEMEEEHEKALTRIDLLENELQQLKENMRLTEVKGKTQWANKTAHLDKEGRLRKTIPHGIDHGKDSQELGKRGEALRQQQIVALSRSLFSSFLSLLVAMVIWRAEDKCVPLVAGLFIVVGISLSSVLDFFSTVRNKPASEAVALLSINWFMLGTLSSPTLPVIARMLAPSFVRFGGRFVKWLGFYS